MFAMGPAFFGGHGAVYATLALSGTYATGTVGTPYSSDLTIAGGDGAYSNARVAVGALPTGLALSIVSGKLRLSGTPTTEATSGFTVAVDSGDGQTASSAQSVQVISSSSAYANLVMSLAPQAYWQLGESSGITATDSSGNGNGATFSSTPTWGVPALVSGPTTALRTSGLLSGQTTPSVLTLSGATSEITLVAWIKLATTTTNAAVICGRGATGSALLDMVVGYDGVDASPGKLRFIIRADNSSGLARATSLTSVNDNVRHMVAFRRTSSKVCSIWVDGVKEASATDAMTAGITTSANGTRLFSDANNANINAFKGDAAHFSVHGYALSDADILALWNAGK